MRDPQGWETGRVYRLSGASWASRIDGHPRFNLLALARAGIAFDRNRFGKCYSPDKLPTLVFNFDERGDIDFASLKLAGHKVTNAPFRSFHSFVRVRVFVSFNVLGEAGPVADMKVVFGHGR